MNGRAPTTSPLADVRLEPFDPSHPARLVARTASPDATRALGEALGELLPAGTLLTLDGDLGSGKTVFCQGLAWGLGVDRSAYVNSPSFTYVRQHRGRLPFVHVDLYRVADPEELELIGLRDFLDRTAVCAVEWPERIPGWLPVAGLRLRIAELPEPLAVVLPPGSPEPGPPAALGEGAVEPLRRRLELEALDPSAVTVLDRLRQRLA